MALNNESETLEACIDDGRVGSDPEPEDEEELEELESNVKKMAEKILEYRATIPDQLKSTLDSVLATQRPDLPGGIHWSEPGPSGEHNAADAGEIELDRDERSEEKIRQLKEKISSNVAAMPVVLKRMKDCISRLEKLHSSNAIIHPAFKTKKTSIHLVDQ